MLQRHNLTRITATLYWLTLAAVTHIPVPDWARKTGFSDKTMHYFAYFILACFLWFAVSPYKKADWRKFRVWLTLLAVILYGIFDEIMQGCMGRSADVRDFVADVIGALAGFGAVSFLSFPHTMLLIAIISAFALPSIVESGLIASGELGDIGINFIAYLLLTAGWIRYKRVILNLNAGKVYFIIASLALPVMVLLCVKLFCIFKGRNFGVSSMTSAIIGIFSVTFIMFFLRLRADKMSQR